MSLLARAEDRFRRVAPWQRDALGIAVALGLTYGLVLRDWSLWSDQFIYHYMAWGVRHGRVLYRDAINMNWPGTVIVHLLAQLLFGMEAAGVRVMEVVSLGALALATTTLLRAYGVGAGGRAASLALFAIAYVGDGHAQTAQRESFMTPCLAVAVLPLLVDHLEGVDNPRFRWPLGGVAAAAALSVKPTAALPLAGALACCLLFSLDRRATARRLLAYFAAGAAGLAAVVLFLAIYGDLRGFYHWGVEYTFGPYAAHRVSPEQRLRDFQLMGVPLRHRAVRVAVEIGAVAVALAWFEAAVRAHDPAPLWAAELGEVGARLRRLGAALLARPRELAIRWHAAVRGTARRLASVLVVLAAVALSIYLQGKTFCPYHFIPLWWAASVVAAVSVSALLRDRLPARVELAAVLVAWAAFSVALRGWRDLDPGERHHPLAVRLAGQLRPDETVVLFGFDAPAMLCELERPTPLPFVDSWLMYIHAMGSPRFFDEYLALWRQALKDPHVRFFLIQRRLAGADYEPVVDSQLPPAELRALGYTRSSRVQASYWDVYERVPAGPEDPRP